MEMLELTDSGPKPIIGYRYFPVRIDNFRKFGWTVSLERDFAYKKVYFQNGLISTKKNNFN